MTFKTNLSPASCPALSGFGVMTVRGPDAARFLQAQLMNDVAALAVGQWHWTGWLTPKGRVIALFALARLDDDRFLAVSPDMPADALREALQRFVFRSKLAIDAAPGWVAAAGPVCGTPAPDRFAGEAPGVLALDFGTHDAPRTLWLLPSGDPALAPADPVVDAAWLAHDLVLGLPRLPPSQREAWTPQMLSLGRLSAFSLKKGCYPGQEIVARTHYLGQSKRELVRILGEGLAVGQPVMAGERTAGTLACATADGREGLAVMAAGDAGEFTVGGRPCRPATLADGLARGG
ncbi:MAG TPA: folate-binding protein [Arenimonas sp.]|uniref:CAF17-like 4Fe-4S cluster assembly/insertion protein YgfZ n=1 Tax=Arenimonas sp. TaxID=1872635 RepID=UPI002D7EB2D5|nr:folate-binding protein [Arenimonas sp.]HEU0153766.1 folate-binding protein [Arenimonas sp.]